MKIYWVALTAIVLASCGQDAPVPAEPAVEDIVETEQRIVEDTPGSSIAPDATEMPIQRVDSLMVSRLNGREETILILAAGSVASDGWTEARLEPVAEDETGGTRSFQFLATSPEQSTINIAPQTVEARLQLADLPPDVEIVRVIAETNELMAFVGN